MILALDVHAQHFGKNMVTLKFNIYSGHMKLYYLSFKRWANQLHNCLVKYTVNLRVPLYVSLN